MPKPKIDIKQAAALIGVSPFTVGCYARGRRIPHYRIGGRILFDPSEVEAWIRARHVADESTNRAERVDAAV